MWDIFKSVLSDDRTYVAGVLVIVAVASFGLGRMSVSAPVPTTSGVSLITTADSGRTTVQQPAVLTQMASSTPSVQLVASKNGTKYHLPTCSGAKQIAEQNKISFNSVAAARAAGYTPAANCPGLQ